MKKKKTVTILTGGGETHSDTDKVLNLILIILYCEWGFFGFLRVLHQGDLQNVNGGFKELG